VEGIDLIAGLVRRAADKITIMACGNLNARNIAKVVNGTNIKEVHITGFREVESGMKYRNERVFMGGTLRPPEYARAVAKSQIISETISRISG
jgi:copper homeostasis protein